MYSLHRTAHFLCFCLARLISSLLNIYPLFQSIIKNCHLSQNIKQFQMQNTSKIKVCLLNHKTHNTRVGDVMHYTLLSFYVATNVAISKKWKEYFPFFMCRTKCFYFFPCVDLDFNAGTTTWARSLSSLAFSSQICKMEWFCLPKGIVWGWGRHPGILFFSLLLPSFSPLWCFFRVSKVWPSPEKPFSDFSGPLSPVRNNFTSQTSRHIIHIRIYNENDLLVYCTN